MRTTTIEQSNELLKLGVNPFTADFFYQDGKLYPVGEDGIPSDGIPCWGLLNLYEELLPKEIKRGGYIYTPNITYNNMVYAKTSNKQEILYSSVGNDLFDVVYNMVIRVLGCKFSTFTTGDQNHIAAIVGAIERVEEDYKINLKEEKDWVKELANRL
jgi:hypothetical protein